MALNTIKITTSLDAGTIRHLLKLNTLPINAEWNVKEFDIKNPIEKTYSCTIKKNNFKIRARKTNQRRQSRPIGYGIISQTTNNNILIHVTVIPHIGSIITTLLFFILSLMLTGWIFSPDNPFTLIPGLIPPIFICIIYILTLKYDTQEIGAFIQKILEQNPA